MITKVQENVIEKSEAFVEHTFKIQASAKAFDILSSGLYADKISAIIRELSANAYDAHVSADNLKTPFLIHLPNQIEPFFSMRDYGIGLCDKDITEMYTTYFQSTKTTSNKFVGVLGLGSKSPFSYTDAFTVTSYFDGMKRVYNAYKNEQNLPTIILMNEVQTNEHNGLEIMFGVKLRDVNDFHYKTPIVLQYFKLLPKIVGAKVEFSPLEYFLKKNKWGIRSNNYLNTGAKAVMGNIAYPLIDYPSDDLTPTEKAILQLNIDINFNIGQLDVSASREKLSYDVSTKTTVKTRLGAVAHEIITELETKIASCTNLWNARQLVYSLKRGEYKIFADLITYTKINWNGQILTTNNVNTDYVNLNDLQSKVEVWQYQHSNRKATLTLTTSIPVIDNINFFIKDITKHLKARCYKSVDDVSDKPIQIFLIKELVTDGIKEFKKLLGMDDSTSFSNVSLLPYDATLYASQRSAYNPKNRASILKYTSANGYCSHNRSQNWEQVEIDINQGGVYVPIDNYNINGHNSCAYISEYGKWFELMGIAIPTVYGVKAKEWNKILDNKSWILLPQYTKQILEEYITNNTLKDKITVYNVLESFNNEWSCRKFKNLLIDKSNIFKNDANMIDIQNLQKLELDNDKHINIIKALNKSHTYASDVNINNYIDKDLYEKYIKIVKDGITYIKEIYPMLTVIETSNLLNETHILQTYVDLIIKNNLNSLTIK